MNDVNLELACGKIRRLEVSITILAAVLVVLISYLYITSGQTSEVIQARGFQLVSAGGQTMGGLEFQGDFPSLYLTDNEGNQRLVATHDETGTQLFLNDEFGTTRVGVAQFSHGGGGIALHGENSKGAAVLYFKEEGSLRFFDADGNVTNQLGARQDNK
jgi:hypothetical protein